MRPSSPPNPLLKCSPWAEEKATKKSSFPMGNSTSTLNTFSSSFSNDTAFFMSNIDGINQLEAFAAVGEGPMRFGPLNRNTASSVQERLMKSTIPNALENYIKLQLACENEGLVQRFTEDQIFRVAAYKDFKVGKSMRLLKHLDTRYLNTTAGQLQDQLRTQTLFPLPSGLQTDSIDSFFYMRPARYNPNVTPTSTVIANLIYVMDTLYERNRGDGTNKPKIGFIANMNDWTMEHFAVDYCFQFMQALQGRSAPLKVDLFLIVNPPSWFSKVWKIMKPMLSPAFRKKVHMIPEAELSQFLPAEFAQSLPDEFQCGQADVPAMVNDFIAFRKLVEESSVDRADKAMNVSLPTWAPVKDATDIKRRRGRRASAVPLSRSHAKRDVEELNSNNGSEVDEISTFKPAGTHKRTMPTSSWSRMKNPRETDDGDDNDSYAQS